MKSFQFSLGGLHMFEDRWAATLWVLKLFFELFFVTTGLCIRFND